MATSAADAGLDADAWPAATGATALNAAATLILVCLGMRYVGRAPVFVAVLVVLYRQGRYMTSAVNASVCIVVVGVCLTLLEPLLKPKEPEPLAAWQTRNYDEDEDDNTTQGFGAMLGDSTTIGGDENKDGKDERAGVADLHAKAAAMGQQQEGPVVKTKASTHHGRFGVIQAEALDMSEDFVPPNHPKSPEEDKLIRKALANNFVFDSLEPAELQTMVDAFEKNVVKKAGHQIITQGAKGDYFYVIQDGTVEFIVDSNPVGKGSEGVTFGELSLLYNCPRAATCTSLTKCVLWRVDQETFRRIVAGTTMRNDSENKNILLKVPYFKNLDEKYIAKINDALATVSFPPGSKIFRKGEEGDVFYMIKDGEVKLSEIESGHATFKDLVLGPGEYFGERAIVSNEPRAANATSLTDVTCMCLSRELFNKVVGDLSDIYQKTQDKARLVGMNIWSNLDEWKIEELCDVVEDKSFPKGHVFFSEGEAKEASLNLVREGEVKISNSQGDSRVISRGGHFGDQYVIKRVQTPGAKSDDTVTATEDCIVGVLSRSAALSVLGSLKHFSKEEQETFTSLDEIDKHRLLGVGTFGKVWLVSKKGTREKPLALKIQSKRQLVDMGNCAGVIREMKLMEKLDSPFILKLAGTFQDKKKVYMLLNLVQGGELFTVLHGLEDSGEAKSGKIAEKDAMFYAAGILEGLSYMHARKILYRDLKPENVMVGSDGYTVIVDLGFAKVVPNKTYTLCGTPLYLAPEVILSRGHDKGADYWSLGVMIYEMIAGVTPFYDEDLEQVELFKKITKGQFDFPPDGMSADSKDLITQMLTIVNSKRLGSLAGGDKDIRKHPWFKDMDWIDLKMKKIKAPWVPSIDDPFDASNFEDWSYIAREGDADEEPLTPEEQKNFGWVSKSAGKGGADSSTSTESCVCM